MALPPHKRIAPYKLCLNTWKHAYIKDLVLKVKKITLIVFGIVSTSTSVRRSTRIKRDESKDVQQEAVQEDSS